ncbi:MAG: phosphotransferase [Aquabacterium sp.]
MSGQGVQDQGGQVRPGEELNLPKVDAWLKGHVPTLQGQPEVTQFSGGASNWTYRLKYMNGDYILRRPPAGTKAKGAHDMGREFRVQQALKPVYPVVPTMIGLCEDEAVTGSEFYVMERIAGIIPRKNMPRGLNLDVAYHAQAVHERAGQAGRVASGGCESQGGSRRASARAAVIAVARSKAGASATPGPAPGTCPPTSA